MTTYVAIWVGLLQYTSRTFHPTPLLCWKDSDLCFRECPLLAVRKKDWRKRVSKAPPQVESGVMGVDIGGFLIFFLIIEVFNI